MLDDQSGSLVPAVAAKEKDGSRLQTIRHMVETRSNLV